MDLNIDCFLHVDPVVLSGHDPGDYPSLLSQGLYNHVERHLP